MIIVGGIGYVGVRGGFKGEFKVMKVGRNDPCPCGRGKKYKKCCLEKDHSENVSPLIRSERTVREPADTLRRKIVKFMQRDEFKRHVVPAARLYWRTLEEDLKPEPMNDTEVLSFNEWFIHDYILADHGKPLITVFLESNPSLTKEELTILMDRHYPEWPDSEIPALDNKTPRESMKSKQGRKKVEDLLRMMEYMEQRKREKGEIGYDFSWMRKELGMNKG